MRLYRIEDGMGSDYFVKASTIDEAIKKWRDWLNRLMDEPVPWDPRRVEILSEEGMIVQ